MVNCAEIFMSLTSKATLYLIVRPRRNVNKNGPLNPDRSIEPNPHPMPGHCGSLRTKTKSASPPVAPFSSSSLREIEIGSGVPANSNRQLM